jgi:hypothetical protein
MALYRMLQPHSIAGMYFDAGSIAETADLGGPVACGLGALPQR